MHFNEGEFAPSRDLMVHLWLQSRQYDKMSPLKGRFVVVTLSFAMMGCMKALWNSRKV